jgi:hypothetical protein
MDRLRSLAQWQPWARVRLVLWRVSSHNNFDYDHKYYYDYDYHHCPRNNDYSRSNDYNGGRKGHYDPARNYDYLVNYDDDSGSTASPATAASRANND